jgi:Alpha-glucosidases, family 31 of glycosyl hydrolases
VQKTKVWLPEGTWFDFFNGMIYEGGRSMDLYRTLEEIPVLAKAGAIIPMTEKISALDVESNPDELTVRVYAGADNTFALYEDDNTTMAYEKDDCAKNIDDARLGCAEIYDCTG